MTLTTHAVAGAAIISFMPNHALLGVCLAFGSHFLLDAIPHYDYEIKSASVNPDIGAKMKLNKNLFKDMIRIGFDGLFGLFISLIFFGIFAPLWIIALGAFFGMLPDPLQFVYAHFKHEPLVSLQRFHQWIHSKNHLLNKPVFGFISQLALLCAIIILSLLLHQTFL